MRGIPLILILLFLSVGRIAAQESGEGFTLRIDTELVVRTVTVRDRYGQPVDGLTVDDFTVAENGVEQQVRLFEYQAIDDTPRTVSSDDRVASGSEQNPEFAGRGVVAVGPSERGAYPNRRLLVFYFDLVQMSEAERLRSVEAAADFVTTRMTAADLVAILTYTGGGVNRTQGFTDDPELLLSAVHALGDERGRDGPTPPTLGLVPSGFDIFATERRLRALETAASMLGSLRGAKSLVYFSSGASLGVANQAQLRATLNAANRSNVAIFPIDSRGLAAFAPLGDAAQASLGGVAAYTVASMSQVMSTFQQSQDMMFTIAADTGGKAFLDSNDLIEGIVRAQQATDGHYLIGYYPTNGARDGRRRQVTIRVKDRSLTLGYQDAYYADKDFSQYTAADKDRQLEEALFLGDPPTDFAIVAELHYFRVSPDRYFIPVAVRIPGGELTPARTDGIGTRVVDFVGEIRNASGVLVRSLSDRVEIRPESVPNDRIASSLVYYDTGFMLPSGEYTMTLVARNGNTGRMGTYQTAFLIPDMSVPSASLPISSVVLGSDRVEVSDAVFNADGERTVQLQAANPLVRNGTKFVPNVSRVFSAGAPLYVYLEAYGRQPVNPESIATVLTLYSGQERVLQTPLMRGYRSVSGSSDRMAVSLEVRLESLPPGEYTCQVTVLDLEAQEVAFWRAPILVIP